MYNVPWSNQFHSTPYCCCLVCRPSPFSLRAAKLSFGCSPASSCKARDVCDTWAHRVPAPTSICGMESRRGDDAAANKRDASRGGGGSLPFFFFFFFLSVSSRHAWPTFRQKEPMQSWPGRNHIIPPVQSRNPPALGNRWWGKGSQCRGGSGGGGLFSTHLDVQGSTMHASSVGCCGCQVSEIVSSVKGR
ncbi:hypothetical protein CGRA01v4_08045 [Colletotrichum graminicola]|nr:hypothetical protein CGRA01v4_08045 [Colletotrichum graminicola]